MSAPAARISFDQERLSIDVAGQRSEVEIAPDVELAPQGSWFGARLAVHKGREEICQLGGFRLADANAAAQLFKEVKTALLRRIALQRYALLQGEAELRALVEDGKTHWEEPRYLRDSSWKKWRGRAQPFSWMAGILSGCDPVPESIRKDQGDFASLLRYGSTEISLRNEGFVAEERVRYKTLMTNHKGQSLTEEQEKAVVTDEDNNLIVAAAGSGKTSVIEAKFRYLVESGRAKPGEILLLAYNKKAADEIEERLDTPGAVVRTFHALGNEILAEAANKKQTVSHLAGDSNALKKFIQELINSLLDVKKHGFAVLGFLINYFYPPVDDVLIGSTKEYVKIMQGADLRSIKGEKVKSFGELIIANLLAAYGIPYTYEADYPFDTATKAKRGYQPDFELDGKAFGLEGKYYVEYFGVDRNGATRKDIDSTEYRKDMQWKRELHKKHETKLVEVYYHQLREGKLEDALLSGLRSLGFPTNPLPPEKLCGMLSQEGDCISRLAEMLATFIRLFKGGIDDLASLRGKTEVGDAHSPGARRQSAFLDVFEKVLTAYEDELARTGHIDFEDMIRKAIECVRKGKFRSPYRYILVDEFQDISPARAALVTALRDLVPDSALTCVGDDWQSIYRFAGSQIKLMTGFREVFGATARVDLTLTHRFPQELASATTEFITRNPRQLRKNVRASGKIDRAPITVVYEENLGEGLVDAIKAVKENLPKGGSVLLLGRYNRLCPTGAQSPESLSSAHPGFTFEFMSVHRSKGLEYDAVILLSANENTPSFPSSRVDDPIFSLILGASDDYPHSEERRLFYVAMTRAKRCVVVTTSVLKPSPFIAELLEIKACACVGSAAPDARAVCPHCQAGMIVLRKGPTGSFYGCSSFPYCDFKQQVCAKCKTGRLVRDPQKPEVVRCSSKDCKNTATLCDRCRTGWMERKMGKRGPFFGCTNWPECPRTMDAA